MLDILGQVFIGTVVEGQSQEVEAVESHPQRPDVGWEATVLLLTEQFRGHEEVGALCSHVLGGGEEFTDSEVAELGIELGVEDNVLGLDVPMDDTVVVQVGETLETVS